METLTPVQRIAVIAICLALTALIAMLLVPWMWAQIVERMSATATPAPGTTFLPSLPIMATLVRTRALDSERLA